jgi:hypothetical protein
VGNLLLAHGKRRLRIDVKNELLRCKCNDASAAVRARWVGRSCPTPPQSRPPEERRTAFEVYHYFRLLFAALGVATVPNAPSPAARQAAGGLLGFYGWPFDHLPIRPCLFGIFENMRRDTATLQRLAELRKPEVV